MSDKKVSLVIPGKNCASTIGPCLEAVVSLLDGATLGEIIFVDDGSTDDTAAIVLRHPVKYVRGEGHGPGAARNAGWRSASYPLVWFIDSDCVAEPDALDALLPALQDPNVGGASGSYGNMNPHSLLSSLIHEEIVERHRAMPSRVDFLATFNVLYRRDALARVGGFDERFLKAQDAELSFRVLEAGYELRFVLDSRVKHFHETRWLKYLRTQRQHGYWRVFLHLAHRGHAAGDSYSNLLDHIQPPLAMLFLITLPVSLLSFALTRVTDSAIPVARVLTWISASVLVALALAQIPMTVRIALRTREARHMCFAVMSFLRAFWRGVGLTHGTLRYFMSRVVPRAGVVARNQAGPSQTQSTQTRATHDPWTDG